MPKKPTQPFGHIAFSKSGKVTKHQFELPDDKSGQELAAIRHFARKRIADLLPEQIVRLPENDNDFEIKLTDGSSIIVELTELVRRDYMERVSQQDYDKGRFRYVASDASGAIWRVDDERKGLVLGEKIVSKLRYPKPQGKLFWLLIWTIESEFRYFWHEGGKSYENEAVHRARAKIVEIQKFPFDEVWVTNLELNPHRIWPH